MKFDARKILDRWSVQPKTLFKHFHLSHRVFPVLSFITKAVPNSPSIPFRTPSRDFMGLEGLSPRSSIAVWLAYASIVRTEGRFLPAEVGRTTYFRQRTLGRPIGDEAFLDRANCHGLFHKGTTSFRSTSSVIFRYLRQISIFIPLISLARRNNIPLDSQLKFPFKITVGQSSSHRNFW